MPMREGGDERMTGESSATAIEYRDRVRERKRREEERLVRYATAKGDRDGMYG